MKTLTKKQAALLQKGLDEVELLRQKRADTISLIDTEINDWMDTLYDTFGEHVEYQNEEGRTIKFRLTKTKRTSYVKVVKDLQDVSSKPMQDYISKSIKEHTSTHERKTLTATRPGRNPSLTPQEVKGVRQSLRHKPRRQVAQERGISIKTIDRIARREGAYA